MPANPFCYDRGAKAKQPQVALPRMIEPLMTIEMQLTFPYLCIVHSSFYILVSASPARAIYNSYKMQGISLVYRGLLKVGAFF